MKKVSFGTATALGLVLTGGLLSAAGSAMASRYVADWATHSAIVADAPDSQRVKIALFLDFQKKDELKALVAEISRPGSAQFRKYLTPDEFRARFAPAAVDVKKVEDTLKELGFTLEHTPKSGLFVEASGTVAQVKAAFKVTQKLYSVEGKILRGNAEEPTIPAKIAGIVTRVAGLDQSRALIHPLHTTINGDRERPVAAALKPDASQSPNAPPAPAANLESPFCSTYWGDHTATLSTAPGFYPAKEPWLICGYTPQQVRQAYGADQVPVDGYGVTVAVVDNYASPTIQYDANRYSKNHGLPPLTAKNFQQILPTGIYNISASDPCGPQGWYTEETLDVESVHSMAPGANILYYANTSCEDPVNDAVYNIIDFGLANIITNSYSYSGEFGLPTSLFESDDAYFLQAAAEGISVLFSSGDDGDLAAYNGVASGSWDATSPYVTAVGGTSLALKSDGTKQEWGWGDYRAFLSGAYLALSGTSIKTSGVGGFSFYSGAGGGPSLVELAPSYQANVPTSLSSFTHNSDGKLIPLGQPYRVTPDIAMIADPYTGFLIGETYAIAGNPISDAGCTPINATYEYCENDIGGTSLASPMFAGVLALVDQALFVTGSPAVGLINPALYSLPVGAAGSKYPIIDVVPPKTPTALLRGYPDDRSKVRLVTMNSEPNKDGTKVTEGTDTSYRTGKGYDEVTGVGTPYVPSLIEALAAPTPNGAVGK